MNQAEVLEKIIKGGTIAIERMLERKARENGFVVISVDGKVVKVAAKSLLDKRNKVQ